jgi:hypothetical protein
MQSAASSSQSIIENSVNFLLRNLQHEWGRQNLPKGMVARLSKALAADTSTTERILLDHGGTEIWAAYFRETHGRQTKESQRAIAAFGKLSEAERKHVAKEVLAASQPHSSITNIVTILTTPRKRRSK